jgi:tRNA1Val (adenine37-N6)-methyltransferase
MANPYFQFKQFRVEQGRCAMKVSTDAVVLGALSSSKAPENILDIGTGTGVLALMMAQKFPSARIDAVEIDKEAYLQAKDNVSFSAIGDRIRVHHLPFQMYVAQKSRQYDLIITNPPYYSRQLRSNNSSINLARHENGLNFSDLWKGVKEQLKENGVFWLILPPKEMEVFKQIGLMEGFYLKSQVFLQDRKSSNPHRIIAAFSQKVLEVSEISSLVIKDSENTYTAEYVRLLKDFMLYF